MGGDPNHLLSGMILQVWPLNTAHFGQGFDQISPVGPRGNSPWPQIVGSALAMCNQEHQMLITHVDRHIENVVGS